MGGSGAKRGNVMGGVYGRTWHGGDEEEGRTEQRGDQSAINLAIQSFYEIEVSITITDKAWPKRRDFVKGT